MDIERLSENQLRLTLTKEDLKERDIKLEEIMLRTSDIQDLVKELMENSLEEYDFIVDNMTLMVETSLMGHDIIIVVTRITEGEGEEYDNFTSNVKKVIDKEKSNDDYTVFNKKSTRTKKWNDDYFENDKIIEDNNDTRLLVYSFEKLDHIINLAIRINSNYSGESSVYKIENQYFLILSRASYDHKSEENLLKYILQEYGERYVSNTHSSAYLLERGDVIMRDNAISTLAKTFAVVDVV